MTAVLSMMAIIGRIRERSSLITNSISVLDLIRSTSVWMRDRFKHLKRSRQLAPFVCLWIFVLLNSGCNQPFEPKAELERKLVVYSILYTDRTTQLARVYTNYDVQGFDPYTNTSDPQIGTALVSISSGSNIYLLKDTMFQRPDQSRYETRIVAYAYQPLPVGNGQTYNLRVESSGLPIATASVTIPARGFLGLKDGLNYLLDPNTPEGQPFILAGHFGTGAVGFVLRFYVEYESFENGVWIERRQEVPWSYTVWLPEHSISMLYPSFQPIATQEFTQKFSAGGFFAVRKDIYSRYPEGYVRLKRARFVLLQLERQLYDYYKIANGFEDVGTIRTDQPEYSNINGGFGIFGGCAVDSLVYNFYVQK